MIDPDDGHRDRLAAVLHVAAMLGSFVKRPRYFFGTFVRPLRTGRREG
jgi:hypothetical protein